MSIVTCLLSALLLHALNANGPVEHERLRTLVSDSLGALDSGGAYYVYYSTYEVLTESELGRRLEPLREPSTAREVQLGSIIETLAQAAKAVGRTVPEQLKEVGEKGVPEYARKSGLLIGGGQMLFQVMKGPTRLVQSCLSDTSYVSIVRTPGFDVTYFQGESRLEIVPRNAGLMLLTPSEFCFPLPTSGKQVSALLQKEWSVVAGANSSSEIHVMIGGDSGAVMTLVMGGPDGRFPIYCSRRPSVHDAGHTLSSLLEWRFDGDKGTLNAVLQVQQSTNQLSVVHCRFESWRPLTSDDECVLIAKPLKSITDARGSKPKRLKAEELPAEVATLLEIVE